MQRWNLILCVVAMSLSVVACDELTSNKDGSIAADMRIGDGPLPAAEYKFVKIEDLSTITGAQDGADIDAVELMKGTTASWASTMVSCKYPDGSACVNADKAIGPSDAFCTDPTKCFSNVEVPTDDPSTIPPYVSLLGLSAGVSGELILQMASPIANGDHLIVYEVGGCAVSAACTVPSTANATAESIKVSVATSATGPWVQVLAASSTAEHPDVDITIAGLP